MKITPPGPGAVGAPERFSGHASFEIVAEVGPVSVGVVTFRDGARTAWHTHALGQTLHIVSGVGRVQSRGGDVTEVHPGDTIVTPPGVWHWHGAAVGNDMVHMALSEQCPPEDGPSTTWGEHVS